VPSTCTLPTAEQPLRVAEFDLRNLLRLRRKRLRMLSARRAVATRRRSCRILPVMTIVRSLLLFALAALAEIGGAWLVWQGVREQRGLLWIGAGVIALGLYGFVATLQPDANFGRILAAYGGVFVAGSLAWGMVLDGFRPDRWDVIGALVCLAGVAVIMYAPRG
jgi:small multidrug resistance family-3 protein